MSMPYYDDPELRARQEKEGRMYNRIMRDGKLDRKGYLIQPPEDMNEEEKDYYHKLLKERGGKIQYTI